MAYGNLGIDTMTTSTPGGVLGAGNASIMKNRLINGATLIDQRNNGSSVTLNDGSYPIDRFAWADSVDGKFTGQQNSGNAPTTQGFTSCLKLTSSSAYSVSSTDYFLLNQNIEGFNVQDLAWGTASAKTITLSFWVNCSLTGTFGGVINNGANDRSYAYTYTVSSANAWEYKTVTIAGDTSGTWITNNGLGMRVRWTLGAGSTRQVAAGSWNAGLYLSPTGITNVVSTNGATFYITGVQLEVGPVATGYEYRQYGQELALCQRYYTRFFNNVSSGAGNYMSGTVSGSNEVRVGAPLPTAMRTDPTLSYNNLRVFDGASSAVVSSIIIQGCSTTNMGCYFQTVTSPLTIGNGALIIEYTTTSWMAVSAEL